MELAVVIELDLTDLAARAGAQPWWAYLIAAVVAWYVGAGVVMRRMERRGWWVDGPSSEVKPLIYGVSPLLAAFTIVVVALWTFCWIVSFGFISRPSLSTMWEL